MCVDSGMWLFDWLTDERKKNWRVNKDFSQDVTIGSFFDIVTYETCSKHGFIKMSYITLTTFDNFANKWANIVQFNERERERIKMT